MHIVATVPSCLVAKLHFCVFLPNSLLKNRTTSLWGHGTLVLGGEISLLRFLPNEILKIRKNTLYDHGTLVLWWRDCTFAIFAK